MSGHRWRAGWDYPMESGLVVVVEEAEARVSPVRRAFDPYVNIGVPAHITVLYPFLTPSEITSKTLRNVADAVRYVQPFSFELTFELTSVESFDDSIIYLAPSPAEPFVELTNKLWSAFPEFPPFGGRFDSVIPHMSVGGADFGATKETITEQLAGALPIGATARQVTLLVEDQHGWTSGGSVALGG